MVTDKTSQICQYRVCPPVASMQATQRRRILLMSLAICSWGILLHSSCKAAPKAWSVLGRGTLCRTRWPRMYQTCSIGDKSGDRAGQSRWSTIPARWGLALSSCSTTWYHKTSSSIPVMFNSGAVRCEVDSARFEQTLLFQFLRDVREVVRRLLEQECLFKPCGIDFTELDLELGDLTLGYHFPRDIDKPGWHGQGRIADGLTNNGQLYSLPTSHGFCWICLTDDVSFGVAEVRGTRTAPLLNMTGMEEEVLWYGAAYLVLLVLNGTLTGQRYINEVLQPVVLPFIQQHHVVLQDDKTSSGEDSTAVPAAEQCGSSRLACSIPWLVANRACLGHSRPACTTESSTTKNAPSFGRSLAGGVEEDTPATDCQTHQEYSSSLCGLHRCNRWTYAILTDLWGFIGDHSDLPYKFSHSLLVLQTPTDGFLSVNEMM